MAAPEAKNNRGLRSPCTHYCWLWPLAQWDTMDQVPSVMLLKKKKNEHHKCPEHLVPALPRTPRRCTSSWTNAEPRGGLLGAAPCCAHRGAQTLTSCPRGLGAFPRDSVCHSRRQTPILGRSPATPWKGKWLPAEKADSDAVQSLPVAAHEMKVNRTKSRRNWDQKLYVNWNSNFP